MEELCRKDKKEKKRQQREVSKRQIDAWETIAEQLHKIQGESMVELDQNRGEFMKRYEYAQHDERGVHPLPAKVYCEAFAIYYNNVLGGTSLAAHQAMAQMVMGGIER